MNNFSKLLALLFVAGCDHASITPKVFDWAIKLCEPNGGILKMKCTTGAAGGCQDPEFNTVECTNSAIFYKPRS